jgi:sedoheptulokinase
MHFIGIDIGTTSICGVIFDYNRKTIESVTRKNPATIPGSEFWEKIQDPDRILGTIKDILSGFQERFKDIKGFGLTGQMHGILYVDKKGNAISPLITWQDGRANQVFNGSMTYARYLSERSGYSLSTGFGLATHFYNLKNRLVPVNAAKICTIMDYVVMKLTGRNSPLTDSTNGASLGFFDKVQLNFDTRSLENCGIDPDILPDIEESATLSGFYDTKIPVYQSIGDNQASFIGSVTDRDRSVHLTIGTGSQVSVFTERYASVEQLDTRPFPGGGYILVGASLCGGRSFALLNNFFGDVVKLFTGSSPDKSDLFKAMISIDYNNAPDDLPLVNTLFDGTRSDPGARGKISNISVSNLTPGNLIIAFLNGISAELYDFYNLMPGEIREVKNILVGSGNAIRMNKLLCRTVEEQFGRPLIIPEHKEEASFGACLCAVVGSGVAKNFMEACGLMKPNL